ncbi:hypothetical protein DAPPUDRAFT_240748 [Daphnia pulex]|uniref:BTB domain-containing protein n=1 Tax=Daphnia pulex TaxID=6669 RepID=E9GCF4_DAPPU|nr:hypothetical protein DAPPUDRAFT_240748 [Daphnia pulex]|eukprot:EFX82544.1 hypothetical protein DAPPUDRAFT_240748 [Daphnia pulex]
MISEMKEIYRADPGYSYQLCDRLAKDQLWAALMIQKHLADVEFVVNYKIFPAHKSILAARSQVFADEFEKVQPVNDVPHQIRIETGADPSTVLNFLHFVYTGEPIGTLADEELLKLAEHYQLLTLANLCKLALEKIDAMQMAVLRKRLNSNPGELSSSKIMPEEETEIFFDRTTPTFRCPWLLKKSENGQSKSVMQYLNEKIFIAYFTEVKEIESQSKQDDPSIPVMHFTCAKHRRFGLKVEDVYCGMQGSGTRGYMLWLKMEPKYHQENAELLHFTEQALLDFSKANLQFRVYFDIKTVSTIGNYNYEMMDDKWTTDFWMAAINQKWTDVEIFVGTFKVMEVHRIILCARSPVLNASLSKISSGTKSEVYFQEDFGVGVVQHFFNFLYTGSLKSTDSVHQLSKLATIYQVETLKNVCQLLNRVPDVEELSDCLIQLEPPDELPINSAVFQIIPSFVNYVIMT